MSVVCVCLDSCIYMHILVFIITIIADFVFVYNLCLFTPVDICMVGNTAGASMFTAHNTGATTGNLLTGGINNTITGAPYSSHDMLSLVKQQPAGSQSATAGAFVPVGATPFTGTNLLSAANAINTNARNTLDSEQIP